MFTWTREGTVIASVAKQSLCRDGAVRNVELPVIRYRGLDLGRVGADTWVCPYSEIPRLVGPPGNPYLAGSARKLPLFHDYGRGRASLTGIPGRSPGTRKLLAMGIDDIQGGPAWPPGADASGLPLLFSSQCIREDVTGVLIRYCLRQARLDLKDF